MGRDVHPLAVELVLPQRQGPTRPKVVQDKRKKSEGTGHLSTVRVSTYVPRQYVQSLSTPYTCAQMLLLEVQGYALFTTQHGW